MIFNPTIFKAGGAATTKLTIDGTNSNGSIYISNDSQSGENITWNRGDVIEREVPVGTIVMGTSSRYGKSGEYMLIYYRVTSKVSIYALSVVKDVVLTAG